MRRVLALMTLVTAACGGQQNSADHVSGWLNVLHHKRAAASPNATVREKQVYADSLSAFVRQHPAHSRAREVYQRVRIDFARELSMLGRHQDAVHFYRAVLADDPNNEAALRGLAYEADQLVVSREKLLKLQRGMSQHDVARLLGKPMPGWTVHQQRRDSEFEAWYYRHSEGGIAGVYFRDGELLAAEENSQAKLAPLSQGAR
jgi:hypothetical protein